MRSILSLITILCTAAAVPALAQTFPADVPDEPVPLVGKNSMPATVPSTAPPAIAQPAPVVAPSAAPPVVAQPIPVAPPANPPVVRRESETRVYTDGKPVRKRIVREMIPASGIDSYGSGAIPALPLEPEQQGGIPYLSGGIGDEELAMLRQHEGEYNVQLLMAANGGAYISGAMVRVINESGNEILIADDVGPYIYVKLPAGKYTFDITAPQGGIKKATVNVPASGTVKPIVRFTE